MYAGWGEITEAEWCSGAYIRIVLLMSVVVGELSLLQVTAEYSLLNVCSPTDQGLCAVQVSLPLWSCS